MEKEVALAVQEIAKTSGIAIEAAEKVGAFLNKVFGSTLAEFGGAIHDWAAYFRYRNLVAVIDRVEKIHTARKLEGKSIPIPPRYAIPLIQAASQEDDDELRSMWAGLIANATDPNQKFSPRKVFISVLGSLEPLDLKILRFLSRQGWLQFRNIPGGGFTAARLSVDLSAGTKDIQFSLQNLHRLGCIVDEYEPTIKETNTTSFGRTVVDPKTSFRPSPLAFSLLAACEVDPLEKENLGKEVKM